MRHYIHTTNNKNMKQLEKIQGWDWATTRIEHSGYDQTTVPTLSEENLQLLAERHNEMVETVNRLIKQITTDNTQST